MYVPKLMNRSKTYFQTFSVPTVRRGNHIDKTRFVRRSRGRHRKRVGGKKEKNATDTESKGFFLS